MSGYIKAVCFYMVFVMNWCKPAVSFSVVDSLPGFTAPLPFKLETGYTEVDDLEFFYYFIESERNPAEDPLVLWLTGGPGCSSLSGFFLEIGPLHFNMVEYDGSLPTFFLNQYAWTKWLQSHPKFISNPLYIAGDSYSGMIVPIITQAISDDIEAKPVLNLKGYLLGNPFTDAKFDGNSKIIYYNRMALISDELYESAKSNCKQEYIDVEISNRMCVKDLQTISECTAHINPVHILEPHCPSEFPEVRKYLLETHEDSLHLSDGYPQFGCRNYYCYLCKVWATDISVQKALHIRKGTIKEWVRCNKSMDYDYDVASVVSYHLCLNTRGYRALIYSGDHDLAVTYVGTESWIKSLNLSMLMIGGHGLLMVRLQDTRENMEITSHLQLSREQVIQLQSTSLRNLSPCSKDGFLNNLCDCKNSKKRALIPLAPMLKK
ncbi:hypothetical protein ES332_D12G091000v1 [Gossypium tomentosum]|uniref:Serine carboxypeptidase-like 18 n=1 Tax=Gossypium tomentosum TaxID=34277 RepID=A0A5D2I6H6_GOSTO|nr:hypothetical protein ES332_D12G091000v1 [Gossypium tomentosum]